MSSSCLPSRDTQRLPITMRGRPFGRPSPSLQFIDSRRQHLLRQIVINFQDGAQVPQRVPHLLDFGSLRACVSRTFTAITLNQSRVGPLVIKTILIIVGPKKEHGSSWHSEVQVAPREQPLMALAAPFRSAFEVPSAGNRGALARYVVCTRRPAKRRGDTKSDGSKSVIIVVAKVSLPRFDHYQ